MYFSVLGEQRDYGVVSVVVVAVVATAAAVHAFEEALLLRR